MTDRSDTDAASPAKVERLAGEWRAAGRPFARATVVRRESLVSANVGDKALVTPDGELTGWIGGAACAQETIAEIGQQVLRTGEPVLVGLAPDPDEIDRPGLSAHPLTCHSGGTLEVFVEPVERPSTLLIVGASPFTRALARLATAVSMRVVVADPAGGDHPGETVDTVEPTALADRVEAVAAVVVGSMGEFDARGVAAGLSLGADYVGLIASETRAPEVFERAAAYLDDGDPDAVARAVTTPAGLDIGARTPDEVAVSILAELVAVRDETAPDREAIGLADEVETAVDPVCGMDVALEDPPATVTHDGEEYYFCCQGCAEAFADSPEAYA